MTTGPTATPATPAPDAITAGPELELERGDELSPRQLYALGGLLILGTVALVLLRATRRRAGELGVTPTFTGAPSAPEGGGLGLELDDTVPQRVRGILEHYAHATEERLEVCADAVQGCHDELVVIRMRLAELDAGKPVERGAEPAPAPRGAAHSARESDDLTTTDAGALEPVPALVDASNGTE